MLHLGYDSLVIGVRGAHPAPLAWLAEFFGPSFLAPAHDPDRIVALALDPQRFEELARDTAAASGLAPIDCFTRDGSFARLPARREPDGSRTLHDERAGVFFRVRDRGAEVTVLARGDGPGVRLGLLRVVREMFTVRALQRGHLHLHGAAVEVGGRVVAIAGPRRSGKSTLLLHALLSGGGERYVSNDRLLLDLAPWPPLARGMPTIVALREETLALFPVLEGRLRASGFARHRTLAEAATARSSGAPGDPDPRWPPSLAPAQLCALAGVAATGGGPLAAVVLPRVVSDVAGFDVRPLPSGAPAAARLRQSLLVADLPERPAAAFDGEDLSFARDDDALRGLCARLAERVPCLDVCLGPAAYQGEGPASLWGAIRERLG